MKSQKNISGGCLELSFFFENNEYGEDIISRLQKKLDIADANGVIDEETVAAFGLWKQSRFPELYEIEPTTINHFMFEKLLNEFDDDDDLELETESAAEDITEAAVELLLYDDQIKEEEEEEGESVIAIAPKLQLLLDSLTDESDKAKLLAFADKMGGTSNWIGHSKYSVLCDSIISSGIWPN